MPANEFGPKLKLLREQAKLSQRELARKVGIDFSYLSKIESGVLPPPSQEVILKLAKALRTDSDELLTLAGKVPADIARKILKNRDILRSLREGGVESKSITESKGESFSKKLKELREKAGLSQSQLAARIGISFTYLSKLEHGVRPPPSEKVITKLAEALGCNKDDLMALAGKVPSDIAGVLRNQELRKSIRNNLVGRPVSNKNAEKKGASIMKQLLWGKNLARIALAVVLVFAVAISLWYASPSQVKALKIDITDAVGNPLASGTLGQTYSFKVTLVVENPDLIPAAGMDIQIINASNPGLMANLLNLPFSGAKNYTNVETGGGAANVTVTQVNVQDSTGFGYVQWKGYAYRYVTPASGYAVISSGLPATITYSVNWTPPLSWTAGNYYIKGGLATTGNTQAGNNLIFVQDSAQFALQSGAAVGITVALQGGQRPADNLTSWAIPLTVKFFAPGADVMVDAPLYNVTQTTSKSGPSSVTTQVTGITPGNYIITAKSAHTLMNVKLGVSISSPSTAVNLGTLLEGNAKEDTPETAVIINIYDFGVLSGSWQKETGDPGWVENADFDRNGIVNIYDFGLLSGNWQKQSPVVQ